MDPKKVLAIVEWQPLATIPELRSFLGLANYYRKFIAGYSKKTALLTDLLKKNMRWEWSDACKEAFETLKMPIASELVLRLLDFELPFEVHTDAFDKAIGGVLVQEGYPVAFESRKLNAAEQKYSAHEKEVVAIVHCLQQEFLAEYDFAWEHKPRRHNQVADALSRREVFATFYSISRVESDMLDRVKAVVASDTTYGKLVQQVRDGVIQRYWIEDNLLIYKGGGGNLRTYSGCFLKVDGMSFIMVVVDRFSKYTIFIAAPSACPLDVIAELFYRHVVKFFSLPNDISSATEKSPFEIVLGEQLTTPMEIAKQKSGGK
ncbi:hypothetical protein ZIOFF_059379 [Zingiber officinale]|uniref:Reverse transcriptase/retrotransposon-derived protein RNase H-like domain-containing protein n=1 Tax=Zingiber officinale TaxID=94328 RepID=A0A8J5F7D4_ZINOF|nr:hypothetical protein ZIOFF_059379 [Zingiber officinale]